MRSLSARHHVATEQFQETSKSEAQGQVHVLKGVQKRAADELLTVMRTKIALIVDARESLVAPRAPVEGSLTRRVYLRCIDEFEK